jgi:hypothetical protein
VEAVCATHGVPMHGLGVVDSGIDGLQLSELFAVRMDELRAAHDGTIPAVFAH